MSVSQSAWAGAGATGGNAARRETIASQMRQGTPDSYEIPNAGVSDAERVNNTLLDAAESQEMNMAVTAGMGVFPIAASSTGPFAVGLAAGMVGGYAGSYVGDMAGHAIASALGMEKVATEGDIPARLGDPIAHQKKSWGLWGAIGGVLLGAVAAVAVGALVVATGGAALVVVAGAAAAGGFVGGAVASAGAAMSQYGENKGTIIEGSPDVFFEGRPVARAGDRVACKDHPGPDEKIAEGAKTVLANGKPVARLGHRTTCDGNINAGCATITETLETAFVYEVKDSRNPWLRWAAVIVNFLPIPRGRRGGQGRAENGKPTRSTSRDKPNTNRCTQAGEPVDVASGDFLQVWPVIAIPGVLPLELTRIYRSSQSFNGSFGAKWVDNWSQRLQLEAQSVRFVTEQGMELVFHTPDDAVHAINLHEGRYVLFGNRSGVLRIFDRQRQQVLIFGEGDGDNRRLSAIEDRTGNAIRFDYRHGELDRIEHSDGYALHVEMNNGQLRHVELVTPHSSQWLVKAEYGTTGYLASCQSFQYGHLYHEYTSQGYMSRWHDTSETDVSITYDVNGRVLSTRTRHGHYQDRFEYNDTQRHTRYFDAEGGVAHYWYNEDGLVTRSVDPLGRENHFEWDLSNLVSQTDALGRTTTFRCNEYGDTEEIITPDGESWRWRYDDYGQATEVAASSGARWQWVYGGNGELIYSTDAEGRRSEYRYGGKGELLRQILPGGVQWRYDYDAHRRLRQVENPAGDITQLHQDVLGRVMSVHDALGFTTRYGHHAGHASPAGSVTEIHLPDDVTQYIGYTSERLQASFTDGEGKTTRYRYGAFDLLMQVERPDGQSLRFDYDRLARLTTVTNAAGDIWRYVRDGAGQVTEERDFAGRVMRYEYDAVGRRIRAWLPGNEVVTSHYDRDTDRLLKQQYWYCTEECSQLRGTTDYVWDRAGRLLKADNGEAVVTFEYDATGRLVAECTDGHRVEYGYDDAGRQTEFRPGRLAMGLGYDGSGRLSRLEVAGHDPLNLHYNARGEEQLRESGAGFALLSNYTPAGLLANQAAGMYSSLLQHQMDDMGNKAVPLAGTAVSRRWYYDKAYNITGIDDQRWGRSRWQYDVNDQIIHAHFSGAKPLEESFRYDVNQNMIARHCSGMTQESQQHTLQRGRVTEKGPFRYTYDEAGRLTEKRELRDGFRPQCWKYRWNSQNQLSELQTPKGERWKYCYDAFGRRVRKWRVATGTTPDVETGVVWQWSGDRMTGEAPLYADGTVAWDKTVHWLYAPGALTPSARYEEGHLHYVVADHLGTPRELLTETGRLAWSSRGNTWGRMDYWALPAANDGELQPQCALRFPGQYEDEESGLHYNRYRYYDPETGQYLCADPIGLRGGFNLYQYASNPLSWIDPLGLSGNPATATHITYLGIDAVTGKPYVGYASMQGHQTPQDVLNYRYGGNFERFGGQAPRILYDGYGQAGKDTARGLEQRYFEQLGRLEGTANKQNPVGEGNARRTEYLAAADEHLNRNNRSNNSNIGGKCGV